MLDVFNIMNTPGTNVQVFTGPSTVTLLQWKTWQKPRGAKMVYMIAVGGGSSGGCGTNTAGTSGGGAGGGSGAQSSLLIPASFLPDTLYVQAGAGGQQPATLVSGAAGVVGVPSYVSVEPSTTLTSGVTVLYATGGLATVAATTTAGGGAGTAATIANIGNMPLAGRGDYQFFVGQAGGGGGANTGGAGVSRTLPTTGLMVTGGGGGGGSTTTGGVGGGITGYGLPQYFPTIPTSTAAVTSTPAVSGSTGIQAVNFAMNYGGSGGGGATTTAGGVSGAGGNGNPGSGGGGAGGSNTTNNILARPGNGGPGFVIILTW